jgi:hypothetical protein
MEQVEHLGYFLFQRGDTLSLVLGEGDHEDNTSSRLRSWFTQYDTTIINCNHGGLEYGSVVHPERFKNLLYVWDRIWKSIRSDSDVVVFLEADLMWEVSTIVSLIDLTKEVAAVAPLIALRRKGYKPGAHYDSWGHVKDGKMFELYPPYFKNYPYKGLTEVDSAGSCLAIRGDYARAITWDMDLIRGVCYQIRNMGGKVYVNLSLGVIHE